MTFAGGMLALVAAGRGARAGAVRRGHRAAAASSRWGARAGVFAFPVLQLAFDPVEHVAAAGGACMTLIGLRFLTARAGPRDPLARRARS